MNKALYNIYLNDTTYITIIRRIQLKYIKTTFKKKLIYFGNKCVLSFDLNVFIL